MTFIDSLRLVPFCLLIFIVNYIIIHPTFAPLGYKIYLLLYIDVENYTAIFLKYLFMLYVYLFF